MARGSHRTNLVEHKKEKYRLSDTTQTATTHKDTAQTSVIDKRHEEKRTV